MAQPQQGPRTVKDPYAQRGKTLASSVQRLRGWVGSDPTRVAELGDALVELTGHRLRGRAFAAAAADAQDSVRQAAQLLTAGGAVGAYTEAVDAGRYVTAVVQLASVQAGLGLLEPAARTLTSLEDLLEQFRELRLVLPVDPEVLVLAQLCLARGALAGGEVATANGWADAAHAGLVVAGLDAAEEHALLGVDVEHLLSDVRWAADRPTEALAHLHRARERWEALVDGRLAEPAGRSPALVERLAAPAFALLRDQADRLVATGEADLGLVTRRTLVDLLGRLAKPLGAPVRLPRAAALTDLAGDLLAVDRTEEADASSVEALTVLAGASDAGGTALRASAVRARVLLRTGRADEALALLRPLRLPAPPDPSAELVRRVQSAAQGEPVEPDDGRLSDRARGVVSRASAPVAWSAPGPSAWDLLGATPSAASPIAATAPAETASWLEAERAEAHRREAERAALARAEAERLETERLADERRAAEADRRAVAEAAEASRQEAERAAATEEVERQQTKLRRADRLEAHRLEAERREAEAAALLGAPGEDGATAAEVPHPAAEGIDELGQATQAWRDAQAAGDRRRTRAAVERVVELLRPRSARDLPAHGAALQQALTELAGLRMRGGDLLGARAASREAKAVGRSLNG